jgi:hypothetical protein
MFQRERALSNVKLKVDGGFGCEDSVCAIFFSLVIRRDYRARGTDAFLNENIGLSTIISYIDWKNGPKRQPKPFSASSSVAAA